MFMKDCHLLFAIEEGRFGAKSVDHYGFNDFPICVVTIDKSNILYTEIVSEMAR